MNFMKFSPIFLRFRGIEVKCISLTFPLMIINIRIDLLPQKDEKLQKE